MTFDVTKLSREDILTALKLLKEYRTATKQIGKRASISQIAYPRVIHRVEYPSSLDKADVKKMTESLFSKLLSDVSYKEDETMFVENTGLSGGLRFFIGDDMMDISYDRFVPLLMKLTA